MTNNILLIEDNPEMADNICEILRVAGYQVEHAPNGKLGVEAVQKKEPDIILCDVMMPELDGYGVLHILSRSPETAAIPFIFLTAKSDMHDLRTGLDLGADDYITKPFDQVHLLKTIEMRLKKKEAMSAVLGTSKDSLFNSTKEQKEFQKLLENRHSTVLKKKDILFKEGQTPNDLYFLEKGCVKSYKINYDGKELITGFHNEGEFIGFAPLLEDKPYNDTAEILEDARLLVIPKSDFISLIYSSKDIARKFIKLLSGNIEEMENRLLDTAYQSVRQRVARTLLKINEDMGRSNPESLITIARKDISSVVGTATESLNRTIADFRDEKLIEIREDGLRIIDKSRLERLLR
jgi:CRP-like cAMP-binding protein